MKTETFFALLEKLDDGQWQQVAEGQAILMIDDQYLQTGPLQSANAIVQAEPGRVESWQTLKRTTLAGAQDILRNYYLSHPLTLAGFNHQVRALFSRYGARAFAAPIGRLPAYTLFVEGGEVVAEPGESPKHRYGVFCELGHSVPDAAVDDRIFRWLEQGEAHENYLGMNVCRYNC
jgi:hypothetical protein